jgi:DNA repair exonuclease SbcCD ATPase subunit
MFSIQANTMYSFDENGEHSLEVSYCDSDGVNVGAYSKGTNFEDVILDAIDQLDEAIAEYDDDQADVDEAANLQDEIAKLQAEIAELKARNEELEKRHKEKVVSHNFISDDDLKSFIDNIRKKDLVAGVNKISDFPFAPKWWA